MYMGIYMLYIYIYIMCALAEQQAMSGLVTQGRSDGYSSQKTLTFTVKTGVDVGGVPAWSDVVDVGGAVVTFNAGYAGIKVNAFFPQVIQAQLVRMIVENRQYSTGRGA